MQMTAKFITPYIQGRMRMLPVSVAQKKERQTKNIVMRIHRIHHWSRGRIRSIFASYMRMVSVVANAVITCTATTTNIIVRKFVEKSASRFTGSDAVIFALRDVYMYEKTAIVANIAKKAPATRLIVSDWLK